MEKLQRALMSSWMNKQIKIYFHSGILFSNIKGMKLTEAFNNMEESQNHTEYLVYDSIYMRF